MPNRFVHKQFKIDSIFCQDKIIFACDVASAYTSALGRKYRVDCPAANTNINAVFFIAIESRSVFIAELLKLSAEIPAHYELNVNIDCILLFDYFIYQHFCCVVIAHKSSAGNSSYLTPRKISIANCS